jgi:hypothetical protein
MCHDVRTMYLAVQSSNAGEQPGLSGAAFESRASPQRNSTPFGDVKEPTTIWLKPTARHWRAKAALFFYRPCAGRRRADWFE